MFCSDLRAALRRIALVGLLLVSCAMTGAQDEPTVPYVVERDGVIVGIAWDVSGGQPLAGTDQKMIPTQAGFSLYDPMMSFIRDAVNGTTKEVGHYAMYSVQKGARTRIQHNDITLVAVEFPECDASRRYPRVVKQRYMHWSVRLAPPTDEEVKQGKEIAKKQKQWLQCNFRLTLGDLPCKRTATVGRPRGVTSDGTSWRWDDQSFTVPMADAAPFLEAFKMTEAGAPKEYPVRLEYLDDDGLPLLTLESMVTIVSAGPENYFLDPEDPDAMLTVRYGWNAVVKISTTR